MNILKDYYEINELGALHLIIKGKETLITRLYLPMSLIKKFEEKHNKNGMNIDFSDELGDNKGNVKCKVYGEHIKKISKGAVYVEGNNYEIKDFKRVQYKEKYLDDKVVKELGKLDLDLNERYIIALLNDYKDDGKSDRYRYTEKIDYNYDSEVTSLLIKIGGLYELF